jgi:hypothetical protein
MSCLHRLSRGRKETPFREPHPMHSTFRPRTHAATVLAIIATAMPAAA